jgi:hypothetical protein
MRFVRNAVENFRSTRTFARIAREPNYQAAKGNIKRDCGT